MNPFLFCVELGSGIAVGGLIVSLVAVPVYVGWRALLNELNTPKKEPKP